MVIGYPTNLVIMIVATMAATGIGAWLILSETLRRFTVQGAGAWRWGAAIVLAAWFFLRLGLAVNPPGGTVLSTPLLVSFIVGGSVLGLLPLVLSQTFRQIVRAIPETWVVGIHAIRVLGVVFLALLDMKLLPPEFALPAGYGDITVGVLSLLIVYLLATRKSYARALVIAWNFLGLLDFVTALGTGTLFIGPYATQVVANGISPLYLNFVLFIPTFAVPILAALHIYSLYQMFSGRTREAAQAPKSAAQAAFSGR